MCLPCAFRTRSSGARRQVRHELRVTNGDKLDDDRSVTRIVVVGAGFAGFHAARRLVGRADRDGQRLDVVLVNPTDYFLYVPLLPEVAGGLLDPRRITVSLPARLPDVTLRLGTVTGADFDGRRVRYRTPDGDEAEQDYDRLLLASGSVTKLLPIPGVAEHAHGFRNVREALYLRDHIIGQVEQADATDDAGEREARLTFVVVGAGYTGTEVVAQGVRMTTTLLRHHPRLAGCTARWMLLDTADHVLPGLSRRLSRTAHDVLIRLGVDVRTTTSVDDAHEEGVRLSDGTEVPTRTLVWCVGVRPDPLVEELGLPTESGRLVVNEYLEVPSLRDVWACGDAAAVPDLTKPGSVTAMTAQHAERQGRRAAGNILASLGSGRRRPYKHHDLGFVVDLGGADAAANPLGVPLSGIAAKTVTRGYHLLSLPGNRGRTGIEWVIDAVAGRPPVQLGLVRSSDIPLETA
jgi:NADH dehydrogenase